MRVDSITSQQANLTGSFSGSFVGSVELTGSVSLADTASYVALAGVDGSGSIASRLTAQEDFSSSLDATFATEAELNSATASLSGSASDARNQLASDYISADSVLSGSANNARQAIADDLSTVSSSLSSRITAQEDFSSSLDNTFATEAELNAATASLSGSASTARDQIATDYIQADSTLSSSVASDISTNADNISTNTSDISTLNSKTLVSSSIAGDAQGQIKVNGVNVNVSSLQTTSNPTFANLTGSNILVSNNLVVQGTGSFARLESVTGSAKIIGDAYIILNNNTPAERYAGIVVQDSGSAGITASLEFDGQTNDWFYEYSDDGGVTTDHGVVIFGPEYNTKGSPTYLTEGTIPKSTGSHHIVDSNITDDGSTITLGSNTSITGTVVATGTTLVSGSAQVTSLLPSGVVSGSAQTIANLPTGTVSGSAQTVANLPSGTVSGSAQIDLGSAIGTASIAETASYIQASNIDGTVNNATTSSYAITASFALSVADAGGGLTAQTASTSLTMSANVAYVVTGTAAPITMSLPASPSVGDLIKFANMDDRATLLGRNSSNIMGLVEDMTLNVEQVSFDLVYVGPTTGWTIYGSRALS